jgi:phosphoglycolate phosphatase
MACNQAGVNPALCWYVGDAERDIQAGKAAGMRTVVALYGYLAETDQPAAWGADKTINEPLDLLGLI